MFRPLFVGALLLTTAALARAQTTWYVDAGGTPPGTGSQGDPYTSVQFAIAAGSTLSGDTLRVAPGTYVEAIDYLGKDLLVVSEQGPSVTVLDAGGSGSVVTVDSGESSARLEGFTVQNGTGTVDLDGTTSGGGVYVGSFSSLTVVDCVLRANQATYGAGAAIVDGQTLALEDCSVVDNQTVPSPGLGVDGAGGGVYGLFPTQVSLLRCQLLRNETGGSGGGLAIVDGLASLVECTLEDNRADHAGFGPASRGGGSYASELTTGTQLDLIDCVVRQNVVTGVDARGGGAAYVDARGTIRDSVFEENGANPDPGLPTGYGGGLAVVGTLVPFSSDVLVEDSAFEGNVVNGEGGGAACAPGPFAGHATFRGCSFDGNRAAVGAGLRALGQPVLVEDSRLANGSFFGTGFVNDGGGVHGPALLVRCEIDHNEVSGSGAGANGATLVECDVHHNRVSSNCILPPFGGGAFDCTLTDCDVWANEVFDGNCGSPAFGGGIGNSTATGCTIWGNAALDGASLGMGGGAFNSTLVRCAVYGNSGGGVAGAYGGSFDFCTIYGNAGIGLLDVQTVANSIVRQNVGPEIVTAGSVTWSNVEGGGLGVGNFDAPELFWNPDPGPMGTGRDFHFASASSPGIDAGDPAAPLDPDGSRADLGPYPWDPSWCPEPAVYCTAKTTTAGCTAAIGTTGSPTLTGPDDFHVTASDVTASKPGLLFWGGAPASLPFLGGTLCVLPPLRRTAVQFSAGGAGTTCLGTFDHAFTQAAMVAGGLAASQPVHAQYWYRDPLDVVHGSGLSNAVWWITCP